jgi:hypothetical protein
MDLQTFDLFVPTLTSESAIPQNAEEESGGDSLFAGDDNTWEVANDSLNQSTNESTNRWSGVSDNQSDLSNVNRSSSDLVNRSSGELYDELDNGSVIDSAPLPSSTQPSKKRDYVSAMKIAQSAVTAANNDPAALEMLCGLFVAARNLLSGSEPQSVLNSSFRKLIEDSCMMFPMNSSKRKMNHHVVVAASGPLHRRSETIGVAASGQNPLDTRATTSGVLFPEVRNVALRPVSAGITTVGRPCSNRKRSAGEGPAQANKKTKRTCLFCKSEAHIITSCLECKKWGTRLSREEELTISDCLLNMNDTQYVAVPLMATDWSEQRPRMDVVPAGTEWLCIHKKCYVAASGNGDLTLESGCLIVSCLKKGGVLVDEQYVRRAVKVRAVTDWIAGKGKMRQLILDKMTLQPSASSFDLLASHALNGIGSMEAI